MIRILGDNKDNEEEQKKKWIEIFFKKAFMAWDRVYMESAISMKVKPPT